VDAETETVLRIRAFEPKPGAVAGLARPFITLNLELSNIISDIVGECDRYGQKLHLQISHEPRVGRVLIRVVGSCLVLTDGQVFRRRPRRNQSDLRS